MINLDDVEEIKRLDPKDVLGSTNLFLEQCSQIYSQLENFSFPENYQPVYNAVLCGMGGSALGVQVISHLYKDSLKEPLYINNDYDLPSFVDQDTLVILSSYSGSTEEVLSCFEEAKKRGAKIVGFTTGGRLAQALKEENYPVVIVDPINNPSGQPRLGTGYVTIGTLILLMKADLLNPGSDIISDIKLLEGEVKRIEEEGKNLAKNIFNKIPLVIAASHLTGCAHVLRNQFNETAKSISLYAPLPELNHHLMEGLKNPSDKRLTALFLNSKRYPDKLKIRINLTKDVVRQNNVEVLEYQATASSKLSQALEVLMLGGYLTFYLAMLYGQDPSLTPWVDYFKEQLGK